ncbi:adenylate kinase-domain-containing protein [Piptocephalis cylindrospora]|uniref:Uridylate kinase n=1 Tax=Piptocephalis cylindrospora TaxID=1907219 RepID=A0A4P9Y6S5_9FUNG|nr:adenylate kinase-domain-containing protein [Piptocephalis cylindrospora]|eukprot:RKP13560.1 adenylate kinase-domain-containing protein [Piptocephalis cylindrospora]
MKHHQEQEADLLKSYTTPASTTQAPTQTSASGAKPTWQKRDMMVIFVLGGPGSGKGTNCARLVEDFGFEHLSAGDLLREEQRRPGSQYGELIKNYIREGKIVPMEVTIALLKKAMRRSNKGWFLVDGFPRAMDQALKFEETVVESTATLYFECPESTMLQRLLKRGETSGRVDDNIESIRKRFSTFTNTSFPVIEYYQQQDKVLKVSCEDDPDKVYSDVKNLMEKLINDRNPRTPQQ